MKTLDLPAGSVQFIRARVQGFDVNGNVTNPTTAATKWAFTQGNDRPGVGDWLAGDWETGQDDGGNPTYWARFQATAGQFAVGVQYAMWLTIAGVTEAPVILLGTLNVV